MTINPSSITVMDKHISETKIPVDLGPDSQCIIVTENQKKVRITQENKEAAIDWLVKGAGVSIAAFVIIGCGGAVCALFGVNINSIITVLKAIKFS